MLLSAIAIYATDSAKPAPVRLIEKPLTTEQAQSVQKAWAKHIEFEVAFENSIGMKLRVIPPGTYRMSSPKAKEKGPVEVTLSQAYLISQFEVTQGEWKRVMGPIKQKLDIGAGDRFPIYRVNYTEASEFCRKLTQIDHEAGKLPDGYEYRLPTEVEWEFACRAGTLTRTHFGENMSSHLANYDGNFPLPGSEKGPSLGRTTPVGTYPANAWGLHEIHGNLNEWCLDWYHREIEGGVDPVHLLPPNWDKPARVVRDCSWRGNGRYCHTTNRTHRPPHVRAITAGFRPVLTKVQHGKVAANTHADDSAKREPVVIVKRSLTTEQAQSAQKAWADHIGFEVAYENSIGTQLRVIPPGTFHMNSRRAEPGEGPVEMTLSQAFLIGQFEVTQGEWKRVMGPLKQELDAGVGDRFPVYRVNHTEATDFCRKLTQLERAAGKLPDGYSYRLPTAVEWEFACRAGTLTLTHFGDKMSSRLANYDGTRPIEGTAKGPKLGRTAEVGSYPANAWGVHDILGNVTEWCLDWYHHKLEGGVDPVQLKPSSDWETPEMTIRGGAWTSPGWYCDSANRYRSHRRSSGIGFRLVLTKVHHGKVAAATHAADSAKPAPVRLIEKPLTAEQAQSVQKAWAKHLGFEVAFENSISMKLRVIPPGSWRMSSPKADEGQKGPVEVSLSQPFLISQFEVTQGEWKRVMGPIERKLDAGAGDRFPVYRVDHTEAGEFCRKLTQLERKAGKLPDGYEYRLPTDAEWEFACRAGTLTLTHFGDKMSSRLANYDGTRPFNDSEKGPNLNRTAEVGTYPPNAWGLHNMHGNVSEWCLDWYHHKVKGGIDPVQLQPTDWKKPPMVVRPNSWGNNGRYGHSASRYHSPAHSRNPHIGLRPVLTKVQLGR